MSEKKTFFLRSPVIQLNALRYIEALPTDSERPLMVIIQPTTRKLEQNSLLHALLGELEKKATWQGERLTLAAWKTLMISAHTIATGEPVKLTVGVEGEMVNLRESSAEMSISRISSLIDYIKAWAAMNDIALSQ